MKPLFIVKTQHGYMIMPVTEPDVISFDSRDFPVIQCFDKLDDQYTSYYGDTCVLAAIKAHFEPKKPEGEKA